jgi:hypothetical protein
MLLVLAPLASLSLAGQEHGRTIPLADSVVSWSQCKSVRDHVGAAVRLISEEFRSTKDLPDVLRQTRYSDH